MAAYVPWPLHNTFRYGIALKLYELKNPLGINGLISYNHIKQLRITFNLPQNRDLQFR